MSTERELARGTAVHAALAALPRGRWLLAVSGGQDSMVLLHAMARARSAEVAVVANFDHATGSFAHRAAALVEREALRHCLPSVSGVAAPGLPFNESAWRAARHAFLDAWAAELGATVLTAHTRDDQIETVVQRLLRDAGPRGLAGMRVSSSPSGANADAGAGAGSSRTPATRLRPLLTVPRAALAAYAREHRVPFVEDPSNASLEFQRNRVRHEILPALERSAPGFGEWCWSLGERAAAWREGVERLLDDVGVTVPLVATSDGPRSGSAPPGGGTAVVAAAPFADCGGPEWAVLWPAIAARAGVVMDRRGIERAARWAPRARAGQVIPLSGDATIARTMSTFVVKGTSGASPGYIFHQ